MIVEERSSSIRTRPAGCASSSTRRPAAPAMSRACPTTPGYLVTEEWHGRGQGREDARVLPGPHGRAAAAGRSRPGAGAPALPARRPCRLRPAPARRAPPAGWPSLFAARPGPDRRRSSPGSRSASAIPTSPTAASCCPASTPTSTWPWRSGRRCSRSRPGATASSSPPSCTRWGCATWCAASGCVSFAALVAGRRAPVPVPAAPRATPTGRPSSAWPCSRSRPPVARVVETPFFLEPVGILARPRLPPGHRDGRGVGDAGPPGHAGDPGQGRRDRAEPRPRRPLRALAARAARRALAGALAAAVPAALLDARPALVVDAAHPGGRRALGPRARARGLSSRCSEVWAPTALAALAGGLVPLAPPGRLHRRRPRAPAPLRRLPRRCSYAMAFLAWLKVPSREPVPLFGANFERLLIYSVPLLLPLAPGRARPTGGRPASRAPCRVAVARPARRQWLPALAAWS